MNIEVKVAEPWGRSTGLSSTIVLAADESEMKEDLWAPQVIAGWEANGHEATIILRPRHVEGTLVDLTRGRSVIVNLTRIFLDNRGNEKRELIAGEARLFE